MNVIVSEKRKINSGFTKLLNDVCQKVKKQVSIFDTFNLLLTLDNKIPLSQARESLNYKEKIFIDLIKENIDEIIFNKEQTCGNFTFTIGLKEYGRLFIYENYIPSQGDIIIGNITLLEQQYNNYINKIKQKEKIVYLGDNEVEKYFNDLSPEDIENILNTIYIGVYHIDPVIFYLNDKTFSYFYKNKNLFKDRGLSHIEIPDIKDSIYLLEKLKQTPIQDWDLDEKIFVFNCYWLIQSGSYSRIEEFNGKQLSVELVNEYLNRKIEEYTTVLKIPKNSKLSADTIPEKARYLKSLQRKLSVNYQFYRHINGLTLNKEVKFFDKKDLAPTVENFPINLKEYFRDKYNFDINHFNSVYDFFYSWLTVTLKNSGSFQNGLDNIEQFILLYVKEVVKECNGDIAMSRGIRDMNKFFELCSEDKFEEVCSWSPSNFFCCAVPSDQMKRIFLDNQPQLLGNILKAVSRRMQYNSWHFTPGNFPIDKVPPERHFFFPPQIPDIAEWSDQHHPGHITTAVRYSMRSPEKLVYNNKVYFGAVDLRVFRQNGVPFCLNDLKTITLLTKYIREFYQALLDVTFNSKVEYKIKSFDKSFYSDNYTRL